MKSAASAGVEGAAPEAASGLSLGGAIVAALGALANTVLFPGHTASNDCMDPGGSCGGPVLYHYTTPAGQAGILASQHILPSTKAQNPNDARYGDGQYFTDIVPGSRNNAQISRALVGNPFNGARFTNYLAVDMRGLVVIPGREHVFVVPNDQPLNVTGRIVGAGRN